MEFQADIIRAIQSISTPFLDLVMQAITILGEQIFLVPVAALIFWCVSKELGYWLCGCAAAGNLTVNALKTVFAVARPIGIEGIRVLRASTATGTSFPSGHTQAGAN
ncbi:MAG TPA: phosphatidic acid phosphatase, partial [Oscillospiraceae bacterium]|nr:phosphatidic acid phosphatase [Oscillospiraceae bacterium]